MCIFGGMSNDYFSVAFFVVSVIAYAMSRLLGGKSKDRGDIPEPPKGKK